MDSQESMRHCFLGEGGGRGENESSNRGEQDGGRTYHECYMQQRRKHVR